MFYFIWYTKNLDKRNKKITKKENEKENENEKALVYKRIIENTQKKIKIKSGGSDEKKIQMKEEA